MDNQKMPDLNVSPYTLEDLEVPQGHRIDIFFPDEFDLESATVRGPVPRYLDIIYIRGYGMGTTGDPRCDYDLHKCRTMNRWLRRWQVVDVYFAMSIFSTTLADRLRIPEMRVEVQVKPVWSRVGYFARIRRWFRQRKIRNNREKKQ